MLKTTDSFDKFKEEREVRIVEPLQSEYYASFTSSPSKESFHIECGPFFYPCIVLLNEIERIELGGGSITRDTLERICNAKTVEVSSSDAGLNADYLVVLARTLYNTVIDQRYDQAEIDLIYNRGRKALKKRYGLRFIDKLSDYLSIYG